VWLFLEGKMARRRGGSIVLKADDIVKSDAATGEVKGGDWCLEVKDDQRKLGQWVECTIRPNC
jgi:hypothetical protein